MSAQVRLVLTIHNHQPVGNFDHVFDAACRDSYLPFLDILEEYPTIPISLHISGSLMEWLVEHRAEYIDRLRSLVERGQLEILGGPFYEPILACIPRRDRVGQIQAYSEFLRNLFGQTIRGMWVPERVWEQSFAGDLAAAGIEYTVLDDFHFKAAGHEGDALHGYYITEDEGRLFKIFPGSEFMRYTIPFRPVEETINHLRDIAHRLPNPIVTFGDDGEKFGTWPNTKKHVYQDGWLRRFFDALAENSDWIKVSTLADVVDQVAPLGKTYLPDCSYREMTEWALPTDKQAEFHSVINDNKDDERFQRIMPFVRGGFWRNFRVKYPEANDMYTRMMEISQKLESLIAHGVDPDQANKINEARTFLYRGQCNCPYWHGAFGGLYLPHLRNAIYSNLIAADTLLEAASGRDGKWLHIEADDFNLDARKEIRIASNRLAAYLSPASGGHLYELDIRGIRHNLLATLNRREEPYHETVRNAGKHHDDSQNESGAIESIHDAVHFKQPDLDKKIAYDNWPRKSLVDHFLHPDATLEAFQAGHGGVGDFVTGVYDTKLRRSDDRVEAIMSREGQAGPYRIRITKSVAVNAEQSGHLEITYVLEQLPPGVAFHFAVEFNFAGIPGGLDDRYFYAPDGRKLGQADAAQSIDKPIERLGLIDEWMGIDIGVQVNQATRFWTLPIQTISQSEGGFELVHQSSAVIPHWQFMAPEDGRWSVNLKLATDTSAAQARELQMAVAQPNSDSVFN